MEVIIWRDHFAERRDLGARNQSAVRLKVSSNGHVSGTQVGEGSFTWEGGK